MRRPFDRRRPWRFSASDRGDICTRGIEPRFALMAQYTAARCGLVAERLGLAIVDPQPARELTGSALSALPAH